MQPKKHLPTDPPDFLLFNHNATRVASVTGEGVHLWNPGSWQHRGTLRQPGIIMAAFTPDPNLLVTVEKPSGRVQVWDVSRLEVVHTLPPRNPWLGFLPLRAGSATAVVPVPHRQGFLVGFKGSVLHLYPVGEARPALRIKGLPHGVTCLAVLEKLDQVVVGGAQGSTLVNLGTGKVAGTLEGSVGVQRLEVSKDGKHIYGLAYTQPEGAAFMHTTLHHWHTDGSHQGSVTVEGFHTAFGHHPGRGEVVAFTSTVELQVYGEDLQFKRTERLTVDGEPEEVYCLTVNPINGEVLMGTLDGITVLPQERDPVPSPVAEG